MVIFRKWSPGWEGTEGHEWQVGVADQGKLGGSAGETGLSRTCGACPRGDLLRNGGMLTRVGRTKTGLEPLRCRLAWRPVAERGNADAGWPYEDGFGAAPVQIGVATCCGRPVPSRRGDLLRNGGMLTRAGRTKTGLEPLRCRSAWRPVADALSRAGVATCCGGADGAGQATCCGSPARPGGQS